MYKLKFCKICKKKRRIVYPCSRLRWNRGRRGRYGADR